MAVKHPKIRVALDAASDDFRIIDHVIKAMRRSGIPAEEIEQFCDEAMSGEAAILILAGSTALMGVRPIESG